MKQQESANVNVTGQAEAVRGKLVFVCHRYANGERKGGKNDQAFATGPHAV